jgi:hypothetical protein
MMVFVQYQSSIPPLTVERTTLFLALPVSTAALFPMSVSLMTTWPLVVEAWIFKSEL